MFFHIFKNRLKCIVRDKGLIFWTMIFPLILATLFGMAFSNLSNQEMFDKIDIAVVNNEAYQNNKDFQDFLEHVAQGSKKLFKIKPTSLDQAEKLLEDGDVTGYITVGNSQTKLIVKNSGIKQSIIKSALDEYSQTVSTITTITTKDPAALQNGLLKDIQDRRKFTKEVRLGTKDKPDSSVNYFYSLLAMACLYGAFFGLKEVTDIQANLSKRAARQNISPVHKLKLLTGGLLAGYLVHLIETILLIAFMVYVIKVDFGNQIGYILLTCMLGCATGLGFGAFVSSISKKGEGVKVGILLGLTMTGTFLAGMMSGGTSNIKYIVSKNVPILSYINPVSLITDALYALYYYDTHTRYIINISILCGFSVLFCLTTYLIIRRQKYASI